jgi:hypothetical protein
MAHRPALHRIGDANTLTDRIADQTKQKTANRTAAAEQSSRAAARLLRCNSEPAELFRSAANTQEICAENRKDRQTLSAERIVPHRKCVRKPAKRPLTCPLQFSNQHHYRHHRQRHRHQRPSCMQTREATTRTGTYVSVPKAKGLLSVRSGERSLRTCGCACTGGLLRVVHKQVFSEPFDRIVGPQFDQLTHTLQYAIQRVRNATQRNATSTAQHPTPTAKPFISFIRSAINQRAVDRSAADVQR